MNQLEIMGRDERAMTGQEYPIKGSLQGACAVLQIEERKVLERAGFTAGFLELDEPTVSVAEFYGLFAALAGEYGKPDLPLRLGIGFANASVSAAFLAFRVSRDVRDGVERVKKYKALIAPMLIQAEPLGRDLKISFISQSENFPVPALTELMEFVWLIGCSRHLTGQPVRPASVKISGPVDCIEDAEKYLGAKVEVGQSCEMILGAETVELPFVSYDETVMQFLDHHLGGQLEKFSRPATIAYRVKQALRDQLPSGGVTAAKVAVALAMSQRSLQRKLSAEGKTFQSVLDETRKELAEYYLSLTPHSVEEISLLLGFQDSASFYRFCRARCGKPPSALRNPREATRHRQDA